MCIYKSINTMIGIVMKNPEMLKLVPDDLKTKKMCKHVQKLPYLLRYVLDHNKTQQLCDEAILENSGTKKSVPDCYNNQEMCNKAVDLYPHALEFTCGWHKTQKNM